MMITVVAHARVWETSEPARELRGPRGEAFSGGAPPHPSRDPAPGTDGRLDEDSIRLGGRVCVLSDTHGTTTNP